jgi:mannose-6-phosphate isomerase-like protein (cupin superfamily)
MSQTTYPEIPDGKEIFQPTHFSEEKIEFLWTLKPGGGVPSHVHRECDEHFEVLEGTPTFKLDGKNIHAKSGDKIVVPKKTVHGISNRSKENIKCNVSYQPAHDQGKVFEIVYYFMKQKPGSKPNMLKAFYVFVKMNYKEFSSPDENSVAMKAFFGVMYGTIKLIGDVAGWRKDLEKYRAHLN